ncbi:YceD family protein [Demequina aurantiaca]|uniref:YceD family protein n=1 Tax=Demequina aurantiaca TaxID=676200 RepID=UPI003D327927
MSRRPGAQRTETLKFPAPVVLGTDVIGVPKDADVELELSFASMSDGIWVSGTVKAQAVGECGRCLDTVRIDVDTAVQGLFMFPDADSEAEEGETEDVHEFDGDIIELEEVVRDAVATSLPYTPLCSSGCPGLCDQCGARLADDPGHEHEVIDPRWSALQNLQDN